MGYTSLAGGAGLHEVIDNSVAVAGSCVFPGRCQIVIIIRIESLDSERAVTAHGCEIAATKTMRRPGSEQSDKHYDARSD